MPDGKEGKRRSGENTSPTAPSLNNKFLTRRTILVARWRLTSSLSSDSASDEEDELEDEDASLLDFFFLCLEVLRKERGGMGEWGVGW